jgi:hypothetical protein
MRRMSPIGSGLMSTRGLEMQQPPESSDGFKNLQHRSYERPNRCPLFFSGEGYL